MLDKVLSKVNGESVKDLLGFAESQIKSVAKAQLSGPEKKQQVVDSIISKVMPLVKLIDFPGIDAIYDSIIEKLLKAMLPEVVQFIYDKLTAPAVDLSTPD